MEKLFFLSLGLCLFIKLSFLDSTLTYSPEIWAEAATNYFSTPFEVGFWKSFLILDFGYLPLWPRVVASFSYLFSFSPRNVSLLYQAFTILFISFSTSYIALKTNAKFIKSDSLRFFLSILFSLLLDYELHTFINFSYWGLIPISFYLLSNFSTSNENSNHKFKVIFVLFAAVTILSKAMMVSLLPLLVIIFYHNKEQRKYTSVLLLTIFFQLVITLLNAPTDNGHQLSKDIIETFKNILIYFFAFPFLSFLPSQFLSSSNFPIYSLLGALTITVLFFSCKKKESKLIFISLLFSYGFSLAITLKAYPKIFHISQFEYFPMILLKTRLLFFPLIYTYIILFWWVSNKFENLKTKKIFYSLLIVFLFFMFHKNPSFNFEKLGRLKLFPEVHHSLFENSQNPELEPCLPINPSPWYLNTKNCVLISSELTSSSFITIPSDKRDSLFIGIHLYSNAPITNSGANLATGLSTNLGKESLALTIVDSNGKSYVLTPQIQTTHIIRWKFPFPLSIKSAQLSHLNNSFSNSTLPTIQLIGVK